MRAQVGAQLARLLVVPLTTVGVVSALLVWEIEHVGSIALAASLAVVALAAMLLVARGVRRQIDELSDHYEALLREADEASRRAEAASRLKDEFLGTLSHELRTPLNSILGWTRLLAGGKLDATQTANALGAIERAGWAQSRLIEDLLDLSRIVGGRLQLSLRPTSLGTVVRAVVESLEPAAVARGIVVETHLDDRMAPVSVDPDRFQQMAWHLISNAIKFTLSDGRVWVVLEQHGPEVILTVADTGIGFTVDQADHLFERFRQGDSSSTRRFGGVGLGLGLVRHLAELHGGTVAARSEGVHRGSTFEVRLPARTAIDPLAEARLPEHQPRPLLEGLSVLVVDDDESTLALAKSTLERFGAAVQTARSADEAERHFAASPPDVLLSDLRMPGRDGLQLIRVIRDLDAQRGRRTPAAALTGLARASDREIALQAGFQMHVAKPVDPMELAVTVQQLARRL